MKIFLDTADLEQIEKAASAGLIDGITTNPSLLAKAVGAADWREHVGLICRLVHGPVNLEVVATDSATMLREGRELAKIADNVVVKIPMLLEGMKAVPVSAPRGSART